MVNTKNKFILIDSPPPKSTLKIKNKMKIYDPKIDSKNQNLCIKIFANMYVM